jgi:FkbM family methyltransferase
MRLTGCPVEFRFGQRCCISVGGVLLDYDVRRAGDVLSMDVEGPWEPTDLAFVLDHLRTGGTFYDIGANLGWYSLNVMLKTPASAICFEPQPDRLYRNLALNRVEARVFAVALGAEEGAVSMTREHKAANYVSERGTLHVPLKTLDQLVAEHDLPPPTLIKLDVEGFEYSVLRGAERTLAQHQPTVLCEINGLGEARFGVQDRVLLDFLGKLGYQRQQSSCSNWLFTNPA